MAGNGRSTTTWSKDEQTPPAGHGKAGILDQGARQRVGKLS
jgi:hypothetical protein